MATSTPTLTPGPVARVQCHVCGSPETGTVPGYAELKRVTSDCKPWPSGGRMRVCHACGTAQKDLDSEWRSEIARIYGEYEIYFQAGGTEQAVFDPDSGQSLRRSDRIVQQLLRTTRLPAAGRLLDIGCGNGAFLAAFARAVHGWTLAGTEWSERNRAEVEAIPGVERLYTGSLDDVPGRFDVIALIHALEHIPSPSQLLGAIAARLDAGGLLFVEVPNLTRNPFDLLVADHASHFTPDGLVSLIERAGFEIVVAATDWVPKEISVLARPAPASAAAVTSTVNDGAADDLASQGVAWLLSVRDAAQEVRGEDADGQLALFGTSIAATWMASELGDHVRFFVDEDARRIGGTFMGRPIVRPEQVPAGTRVFIPLGGGVGPAVAARLSAAVPHARWIAAPEPRAPHAAGHPDRRSS